MSNVLCTVSNSFINFVQSSPTLRTRRALNSTDTWLLQTVFYVPGKSPYNNFSNFKSLNNRHMLMQSDTVLFRGLVALRNKWDKYPASRAFFLACFLACVTLMRHTFASLGLFFPRIACLLQL